MKKKKIGRVLGMNRISLGAIYLWIVLRRRKRKGKKNRKSILTN